MINTNNYDNIVIDDCKHYNVAKKTKVTYFNFNNFEKTKQVERKQQIAM